MRMIGSIPRAEDAERFSDYLVAQKIHNMVEESGAGGRWSVWIEHDDDIDRGKSELTGFLSNPNDAKYGAAATTAQTIRKTEEKQRQRRRRHFVDVRTSWGQPRQWNAPLTIVLMVMSLVISIGSNSIGFGGQPRRRVVEWFTYVPPLNGERFGRFLTEHADTNHPIDAATIVIRFWLDTLRQGEVWRLITPIFIHWSFLHLLFNLFWLRDLGSMIELSRGTLRVAALVLAAALISCFVEFLWELPGVGSFGGMSGVVYALFGYVWIKNRYEPHKGLAISNESAVIMIAWLFLCMTGWLGSIANAAHVAGLVVGAAIGYAPYGYRRLTRNRR